MGVSGLLSMLVPLETLPGWPAAPEPSVLQLLLVLAGIPLIITLIIAGASYTASTRELERFGPPFNPTQTFRGARGVEGAPTEVPAGIEATAASGAEERSGPSARPGATAVDTGTGGASARW